LGGHGLNFLATRRWQVTILYIERPNWCEEEKRRIDGNSVFDVTEPNRRVEAAIARRGLPARRDI